MRPRIYYRLFSASVTIAAVCNVFLAVAVFRRFRRPVEYNVRIVEPPTLPSMPSLSAALEFHASTNSVVSTSSPVSLPPPRQPLGRTIKYQYFEVHGQPFALLNSRYYQVGSRHAYGVVSSIFPERIVFESGDYIENVIERSAVYEPIGSGVTTVSP